MNLLLIRHATNDWVGKQLVGWMPGAHLNEEGRGQAEALARRLTDLPLAAVYSSPLERALETAEPLAASHNLDIEVCPDLGETRFGRWEGRTLEELEKEDLWPVVQIYPGGARFPDGESIREVQTRIVAALDALRDAHPGQIVAAVSHSDPIKMAAAYYLGLSLDHFQRLTISPASITAFSFSRFGPRLVCLNYADSLPSFENDWPRGNQEQDHHAP